MRAAMLLILLMGSVSLFGDIVYQGARSVTGPFLYSLGASAAVVGLVSGIGEFAGYGLRLLSGRVVDRTGRYWALAFIGYGLLLAVPLLAIAGRWEVAALFIILERVGKALRTPARDVILSSAGASVGRGWAFGLHQALDQVGALAGPLVFALVLGFGATYRTGFGILLIPAVLALGMLTVARRRFPEPQKFDKADGQCPVKASIPRAFWLYIAFASLTICGFANFQLISFHLISRDILSSGRIPLLYAAAMALSAVIALAVGKLYDRKGFAMLIFLPIISMVIPFLAFSRSVMLTSIGVLLWGVAVAIHVTIMRALIGDLIPLPCRGWAYGVFNAIFGVSWFVGSLIIGLLYGRSTNHVIAFAVILQAASIPVFLWFRRTASPARV